MLTKSKLVVSAALVVATVSAASAESWDPVPGDRNPNPVAAQSLFDSRAVYDARMQAGRSAPTIYLERTYGTFDRAAQTVDGGW